jgi:hypothetical protein
MKKLRTCLTKPGAKPKKNLVLEAFIFLNFISETNYINLLKMKLIYVSCFLYERSVGMLTGKHPPDL